MGAQDDNADLFNGGPQIDYTNGPTGGSGHGQGYGAGNDQQDTNKGFAHFLGLTNDNRVQRPDVDPNAFQYGGVAGGAQDAVNRYQGMSDQAGHEYQQDRGNQAFGLQSLQNTINGTGTSVAEVQRQQGLGQAVAAQQAAAAGARGGGANLAAAQRLGAQQGGQMAAGSNQQAALLRANEVAQAQGQYGGLASTMAGQSSQRNMGYEGMGQRTQEDQLAAQQAQQQLQSKNSLESQEANAKIGQANADTNKGLLTGITSGIAGMLSDANAKTGMSDASSYDFKFELPKKTEDASGGANAGASAGAGLAASMMSDIHHKEAISPGKGPVYEALDAVKPYAYEYKDPARHGEGRRVGVMAQDLERSPAGAALVHQTAEGKAIDGGKGLSLALAANADLHHRVKALESASAAPPVPPDNQRALKTATEYLTEPEEAAKRAALRATTEVLTNPFDTAKRYMTAAPKGLASAIYGRR